jgi:hypothetical protein
MILGDLSVAFAWKLHQETRKNTTKTFEFNIIATLYGKYTNLLQYIKTILNCLRVCLLITYLHLRSCFHFIRSVLSGSVCIILHINVGGGGGGGGIYCPELYDSDMKHLIVIYRKPQNITPSPSINSLCISPPYSLTLRPFQI